MNFSENRNTKPLLSVDFVLLTLLCFIFFFNFHSLILLPVYIKMLGGGESTIGFLMGTAGVSTLIITPFAGYLGDRIGKKKLLSSGIVTLATSTIALSAVETTGGLFYLLRLLQGTAFSLFFVSAGALVTEIAPEKKRAQALGLYGVFTIINYAIAPYFGKIIIDNYGFDTLFWVTGGICLLTLPLTFAINERKNDRNCSLSDQGESYYSLIRLRDVGVSSATLFFIGWAFISALTFIPVYSQTIDIDSFDLYFVAYTASTLFIRIFCGWIPDRYGKAGTAKPSILLFAVSILVLSFVNDLTTFIMSAVLFGIAHGFLYPSVYSIVIDTVREASRTRAFAICSVFFTAGGMFGTFSSGLIADYHGYQVMYLSIFLTALVGFVLFSMHFRKTSSHGQSSHFHFG